MLPLLREELDYLFLALQELVAVTPDRVRLRGGTAMSRMMRADAERGPTVYAKQTFCGSRVFHNRCATLTFSRAVSRVNGGLRLDMALFKCLQLGSL